MFKLVFALAFLASWPGALRGEEAPADALQKGRAFAEERKFPEALAAFSTAIEGDPQSAPAHYERGRILSAERDWEKALADFNEAIRIQADEPLFYTFRARVLAELERREEALADLRRAAPMPVLDAKTVLYTAQAYARLGMHAEAVKTYTTYLARESQDVGALAGRGYSRGMMGDLKGAIHDQKAALALDEDCLPALYNLAWAYARQRDALRALECYAQMLRIDETFADAYADRYILNFRLGRYASLPADEEAYVKIKGWADPRSSYLAILKALAMHRQKSEAAGKAAAAEALGKCEKTKWPYPILQHLAGAMDEKTLLALCTTPGKRTEGETYLGLRAAAAGEKEKALPHLQWVREKGDKSYHEYDLATSELERLDPSTVKLQTGKDFL